MWKFFTQNIDCAKDIKTLRERFPNHEHFNGMHKNFRGVFSVPKGYVSNRDYGEKYESNNFENTIFWEPTKDNIQKIKLEDYESDFEIKIPIKLISKEVIKIVPALALPKKVILTSKGFITSSDNKDDEIEIAKHYNTKFEYARLAYELVHEYAQSDLKYDNPKLINLISLGLAYSYNLPADVINLILTVSEFDIDSLFYACIGDSLSEIDKKKENA